MFFAVPPTEKYEELISLAGEGSSLHKKYQMNVEIVGVATVPENYETRLTEMFKGLYQKLRLLAFDPYDIVLAKLERNKMRDREDFRFLAAKVPLDQELLMHRYAAELRPYLGNPEREDLTLKLWVEAGYPPRN